MSRTRPLPGSGRDCGPIASNRARCLPPQQSAERTADQSAADRAAELTTDRFANIGGHPADHLIGDRSRHVARNDLARRQAAALDVGAEDGADNRADLAEDAAAASARRAV